MTVLRGSCHCGNVKFEVHTELRDIVKCNCSLCSRKNALMGQAEPEEFVLLTGEESLGLYQWNTKVARHYFCKNCGIYTHHWRRSKPCFAYNVACIEGVDKDSITEFTQVDGRRFSVIEKD